MFSDLFIFLIPRNISYRQEAALRQAMIGARLHRKAGWTWRQEQCHVPALGFNFPFHKIGRWIRRFLSLPSPFFSKQSLSRTILGKEIFCTKKKKCFIHFLFRSTSQVYLSFYKCINVVIRMCAHLCFCFSFFAWLFSLHWTIFKDLSSSGGPYFWGHRNSRKRWKKANSARRPQLCWVPRWWARPRMSGSHSLQGAQWACLSSFCLASSPLDSDNHPTLIPEKDRIQIWNPGHI